MMYVYYDVDDKEWSISNRHFNWYWHDSTGCEHTMDLESPPDTASIPDFIAERWVWGRMTLPDFDVQVMTGRYEAIKVWVFLLKTEEDAMHFKLRWGIE